MVSSSRSWRRSSRASHCGRGWSRSPGCRTACGSPRRPRPAGRAARRHHARPRRSRAATARASRRPAVPRRHIRRPLRALGDEDRVRGPIWPGDIVADVVDQQHALANVAVGEADPAREARLPVDGHPDYTLFCQLRIGETEEMLVRRGIDACDLVGHRRLLRPPNAPRFRSLAIKPTRRLHRRAPLARGARNPWGRAG